MYYLNLAETWNYYYADILVDLLMLCAWGEFIIYHWKQVWNMNEK